MGGTRGTRGTLAAFLVSLALSLPAAFIAACGEPLATPVPVFLDAAGSMDMESLAAELAAAFHERFPLVTLGVTGLGTQYGLDALRAGEVDIALASWLPAELDADWQAAAIARDGIAVIVHPDNPIDALGLLQLRDLFGGRAHEWRAVGGRSTQGVVQPVSREGGSGSRAAFERLVMEDQRVTPLAVVAASPETVVDYVVAHRDAIGYVSMAHLSPEVKALRIEGGQPTVESVEEGTYPLTRDLFLVFARPASDAVQGFLDFGLSPAGQEIVGREFGRVR